MNLILAQGADHTKPENMAKILKIIENEKNGLIVPSKDADALYNAMERMLLDDKARETMKNNARQMIDSRFERSFVQKCQIEYYKEIM